MAEATQLAEEDAAGGAALSETRPFRLRDAALIAEIVGLQLAQSNDLAREAAEQKQIESIGALSLVVAENPYLAELMARSRLTRRRQRLPRNQLRFSPREHRSHDPR